MDIVSSISHALETTNKLRALSKKIEDAEFKMLLADLSSELADAKLEAANIKIALAAALEEVSRYKDVADKKSAQQPKLSDWAYALDGEEGLFCTACWDTKTMKVRVRPQSAHFRTFGKWRCPGCGASL